MMNIYLDWNIYNKIEKINSLPDQESKTYLKIEQLILERKMISPYSNAHINDLVRGHYKISNYTSNHLANLKRLSSNLCIVQYWGQKTVTWHERDVVEFFNASIEDEKSWPESFSDLLKSDETGIYSNLIKMFALAPVPPQMKNLYKVDPVFSIMFPKTKIDMNMASLCEDLYNFTRNAKKDYSVFKALNSYINQSLVSLRQQQKIFQKLNRQSSQIPSQLNFDQAVDNIQLSKTSENSNFQKVTNTYILLNYKGYKTDDKFANLIDDALHVFYGAHCDYFITIDDKCYYKASETYENLGIETKVMNPGEFISKV